MIPSTLQDPCWCPLAPLSGCQFISKLMLTQLLYGRCKGRTGITELFLLDLMLLLYRRLEMPPGQYTSITKHAPFNGIFVAETDPSRFLDLLERRRTTILIIPPLLARPIVSLWLLSAHALHRFLDKCTSRSANGRLLSAVPKTSYLALNTTVPDIARREGLPPLDSAYVRLL